MKLVVVRGDHRVNEIKLQNALGQPFRAARDRGDRAAARAARVHRPGRLAAAGAARRGGRATGRTWPAPTSPTRICAASSPAATSSSNASTSARWSPATPSTARPSGSSAAIEVGNIFKLGTRYSEPLGATYLDEEGAQPADLDGLLRVRPGARRGGRGRAVRRRAGDLLAAGDRAVRRRAGRARQARDAGARARRPAVRRARARRGSTTLYDDRDAGPGEKFTDAELLGCPLRVTVGRRTLAAEEIEVQVRRGREARTVPLAGAAEAVASLLRGLP